MKTIAALLLLKLLCLAGCQGQSLYPSLDGNQDFQFLGGYSITPAGTTTVSTFALPEFLSNSQNIVGLPGIGTYPPSSLFTSFLHPPTTKNTQVSVPQSFLYPQLLGMNIPQDPSLCQRLMQMLAAQNQPGQRPFMPAHYKK